MRTRKLDMAKMPPRKFAGGAKKTAAKKKFAPSKPKPRSQNLPERYARIASRKGAPASDLEAPPAERPADEIRESRLARVQAKIKSRQPATETDPPPPAPAPET